MIDQNKAKKAFVALLLIGFTIGGGYLFFSSSFTKSISPSENSLGGVKPLGPDGRLARVVASSDAIESAPVVQKPLLAAELKAKSEPRAESKPEATEKIEPPIIVKSETVEPRAVVEESQAPKQETAAKTFPELWLWLGAGVNYQYHRQSIPNIDGEVLFQNIQQPTAFLRAGMQGETFGLDLSYKQTPGKMESSDTVTVTNGSFQWRTVSVEGLYRLNEHWNLRSGLQHHLMPFMALDATTATIDVKSNTLTLFTVGFDRYFHLSENLRAEWQIRYQHPLLSGSSNGNPFSVTPKFAFDGSVGTVYSLTKISRLGLYWYGQWHEYDFNYGRGGSQFTGSQTLFYSNVELRLGLEF